MLRALLLFALVLGIVIGGLMLLRRTANMQPPIPKRERPPAQDRDSDQDQGSSW